MRVGQGEKYFTLHIKWRSYIVYCCHIKAAHIPHGQHSPQRHPPFPTPQRHSPLMMHTSHLRGTSSLGTQISGSHSSPTPHHRRLRHCVSHIRGKLFQCLRHVGCSLLRVEPCLQLPAGLHQCTVRPMPASPASFRRMNWYHLSPNPPLNPCPH